MLIFAIIHSGVYVVEFAVGFLVVAALVLAERVGHCAVAFPEGMHVAQRNGEKDGVVKDIGHIEIAEIGRASCRERV